MDYVQRSPEERTSPLPFTPESVAAWLKALRNADIPTALDLIDALIVCAKAAGKEDVAIGLRQTRGELEAAWRGVDMALWRVRQAVTWSDAFKDKEAGARLYQALVQSEEGD